MKSIQGGIVCLSMLGVLGGFAGCGSDSSSEESVQEQSESFETITIDASDYNNYKYLSLRTGEIVSSLDAGELGFRRTAFIMNGGDSGDGGVSMALSHTPEGFYDGGQNAIETAFQTATPENYESFFETVQADANITAFSSDLFTPAISGLNGWYEYNLNGDHRLSAKIDSWYLVQSASTTHEKRTYAKFRVTNIAYPEDATQAREIQIEAYIQKSDATAFSTIPVIVTFNVAPDTQECYTFENESLNDCSEHWDIKVQRDGRKSYIKINTSPSGTGSAKAMALGDNKESYEGGMDLPSDISTVAHGWSVDRMESAFGAYNSTYGWGQYYSSKIYPNYRTYLLKKDEKLYAIQITGYYHPETEVSGHITLKYKELQ